MAEARLAVAFQFAVTDDGQLNVHVDKDVFHHVFRALVKSVKRKYKSAKHNFLKWHFPATPMAWVLFFLALAAARIGEHQPTLGILGRVEQALPGLVQASPYIAICFGVTILATLLWMVWGILLQLTLRALLTYRGILFERKLSLKSKIWAGIVSLFTSGDPTLYSFQQSLPRLPVPSLDATLDKHLESVIQIFPEEKLKRVEDLTEEFRNGIGKKLQRYLVLKSWWANNYVTDWWNNFVYLKSRGPLMINSNFYGVDGPFLETKMQQTSKAANLVHAALLFRKLLEKEKLKPLMMSKLVPLCSTQYRQMFNQTRIPGKDHDKLCLHDSIYHLVVLHNGRYFKLNLYHKGNLLKPKDLESQLDKILEDTSAPFPGEKSLAALTGDERKTWAETREEVFHNGVNHTSLKTIENSAFVLVLSDQEHAYDENDATKYNDLAKYALHGEGDNIWFDKSFNIIVFKNGKFGVNVEHAWADAPIMSQFFEWVIDCETNKLGNDENGRCLGEAEYSLNPPERLQWEIPEKCVEKINIAKENNLALISDLDLHVLVHTDFGKDTIKKFRVSPDAFVQMAYQLASYKEREKFLLTYESAMTRLYRDGRTETVRPCTADSCAFVKGMVDSNLSKEEKRNLLAKACATHSVNIRKAMAGEGVDRHLFCLYVVSKYLEIDSPFLNEILSEPWHISTSQTAADQMQIATYNKDRSVTPGGGGFGPVADDGYGLSYLITGHTLIVHITSKKSAPLTSASRFSDTIHESFMEMKALFDE